ncbi:MAG: LPS export ABC transporter permease LptG [Pseudomonadota bacterium]
MTLSRYLLRVFLLRILFVAAILTLIVGLIAFVESLRRAGRADRGIEFALQLTLFEIPPTLALVFPLILMLGALATFQSLSRSSELVIIRASGISALRFLLVPMAAAAVIGVLFILFFNPIVAYSKETATMMRAGGTQTAANVLSVSGGKVWLRQGGATGQTVIQAERVSADGRILFGVRIHQFDVENRLETRIEASSATLSEDNWILRSVRRWQVAGVADGALGEVEELVQLFLPTDLKTEQILDSFAPPETVSIWAMPRFIDRLERAGFSARRHRVYFQSELARPILFAAMVLIGAAFSLRHARFGQTGVMVLFSILAGFVLYFFKDLSESLGNTGEIPILLAAWSPPVAALLLALGLLLHLEDG